MELKYFNNYYKNSSGDNVESLADKGPGIYTVVKITKPCSKFYQLGIVPGSKIIVISNDEDPIIARVGNCKIAIGRGLAKFIMVE